jgi:hypothetical protein
MGGGNKGAWGSSLPVEFVPLHLLYPVSQPKMLVNSNVYQCQHVCEQNNQLAGGKYKERNYAGGKFVELVASIKYIKVCSKVRNVMNGTSDDTPLKCTTKTNEVILEM